MRYDYFELVSAMRFNTRITINGYSGYIRAIQMEDGSGKNYNVTMLCDTATLTTFVKIN